MDVLEPLLSRFSLNARVFYSGSLCSTVRFNHNIGLGFLHVLRAGELIVVHDKHAPITLDAPTFIFLPRPAIHNFEFKEGTSADLVCATFDFGSATTNPVLQGLPEMMLVPLESINEAEALTGLLFAEAFGASPGRATAVNRLADYFIVLLLRYAANSQLVAPKILTALADPKLSKAFDAMHLDPRRDWTLESLADEAGMSRARFSAFFKEITDITPLDYLTDFRIALAQKLLQQHKPLKSIISEVGYSNSEAFSRAFAKRVGITPKAWLKRRSIPPEIDGPTLPV